MKQPNLNNIDMSACIFILVLLAVVVIAIMSIALVSSVIPSVFTCHEWDEMLMLISMVLIYFVALFWAVKLVINFLTYIL